MTRRSLGRRRAEIFGVMARFVAARLPPLIFATLFAITVLYYEALAKPLEPYLVPATHWGAHHLLHVVGITVGAFTASGNWILRSSSLAASQCVGSSGAGCFVYGSFLCLFGFLFVSSPKRFSASKWGLALIAGLILSFLLNVARYALVTALVVKFQEWYGTTPPLHHLVELLGSYIGLPLYALGLASFFVVLLGQEPAR